MDILNIILSDSFWFAVIRMSTPILFATLGAVLASKAGSINIGIEGMMLISALFGVIFSAYAQNAWIGLLGAILSCMIISAVMSYFTLKLNANAVITGIAINILAAGGTIFLLNALTGDKGTSTSLNSLVLPNVHLPVIRNIPFLGKVLSGHNVLTYISFICVILVHILMNYTRFGLRMKAVGESPQSAESVGINVNKTKFFSMQLSGILVAMGGAFLSMGYVSWFSAGMTSGRGYIALAARAIANNTAVGAFLASFLFGSAESLSNYLQKYSIPIEIVRMLPYIVTILGFIVMSMVERKRELNRKRRISEGQR